MFWKLDAGVCCRYAQQGGCLERQKKHHNSENVSTQGHQVSKPSMTFFFIYLTTNVSKQNLLDAIKPLRELGSTVRGDIYRIFWLHSPVLCIMDQSLFPFKYHGLRGLEDMERVCILQSHQALQEKKVAQTTICTVPITVTSTFSVTVIKLFF